MQLKLAAALVLPCLLWAKANAADVPAATLYQQHCASCHGESRTGGQGPALLPENLERLKKAEAIKTITEGRVATQMPAFAGRLTPGQIDALTNFVYSPPAEAPRWGAAEVRASRIVSPAAAARPAKPTFQADPQNLFIVVESGDHHATLLDGDRFEPIDRFKTRFALHGGPKFSPDGRFVYFASRDGWISKYDIYQRQTVAEIRAGLNTRNLAVSDDGRYVLVGNYLPHTLVMLDAQDLALLKVIPVKDAQGHSSRVSAVYQAAPRKSFVIALKDAKEIWEIPYDVPAKAKAWVHDYGPNSGEMTVDQPSFTVRRLQTADYLDDFFFDQAYRHIIGTARDSKKGQVVDLDRGAVTAELPLPGMPHLGSGITWTHEGHPVMATPNLRDALVSVIDMSTWQAVTTIPTLGPGFFLRSHENTPYAWVDGSMGPRKDTLQIIDKRTLQVVRELCPQPGRTAAHVEFTRDGRYALVSLMERDGALIIYDAATFQEIKRLPMCKPVGKYNVFNKTTRSAGTSH
jgi:mono/diheme cytochrome c family protein/DNA-binding beta-propeller fold protein YncE